VATGSGSASGSRSTAAGRGVDLVAFDVNETLFSLANLRPAFERAGLDPGLVPLWFARVLRDGFALTAAGDYRPFAEIGTSCLLDLDPDGMDEEKAKGVLAGFRELDPHPDVEPALAMLQEAGVRVVTLTNGSTEVTEALLERAGLTGYVEQALSVDAVRRWKPRAEPYLYAARLLEVDPERTALIAAHSWDCDGARRAGLRTGWVSRLERRVPTIFTPAEVTGVDLTEVVRGLLTLPAT
jgi:2-haloacid dehalogenase